MQNLKIYYSMVMSSNCLFPNKLTAGEILWTNY